MNQWSRKSDSFKFIRSKLEWIEQLKWNKAENQEGRGGNLRLLFSFSKKGITEKARGQPKFFALAKPINTAC